MKKKNISVFFASRVNFEVLKYIYYNKNFSRNYGRVISVKCNITYGSVANAIKKLSFVNLTELEKKDGRTNLIILTKKGKEIIENLIKIERLLEN